MAAKLSENLMHPCKFLRRQHTILADTVVVLTNFIYPSSVTVVGLLGTAYFLNVQLKDMDAQLKEMNLHIRGLSFQM